MENRKDQHVELAHKFYQDKTISDFDSVKFVYNSLPQINLEDVDLSTEVGGIKMDYPFFINAMTGGSENTKIINEKLAYVAKKTGIAMASGSLSAAIKDSSVSDSFKIIREVNADGIIFANIGAEYSFQEANKAISILKADALQIHLNLIQELIMPEGDRDFTNWLKNIESIIKNVNVPVIIKEVGFGMSRETINKLYAAGARNIDISGAGGTNFASIENFRREASEFTYLKNFGNSTIVSLFEAQNFIDNVDIISSGGVKSPLDIVKSLALGAKAVGLSAFILNSVLEDGVDKTIAMLNSWKDEIKVIMTILGSKNITELKETDLIVTEKVKEWCEIRKIDYKSFANRSK